MKAAVLGLLLLQAAASILDDSPSRHQPTLREIHVPPGATGQTCVVLDAAVYAHAAGQSLNDVRLFAAGSPTETPFTLTESNTARTESEPAAIENPSLEGNHIAFDLAMPHRPYTSVDLNLQAHDFIGTAHVWGHADVGPPVSLGEFAIFDLTGQHLSRSTTLPLQESTFPALHVDLQLRPAPGITQQIFPASIVTGASVPPSRSAQTLYTTVATTSHWKQHGFETVATLDLPAHVPVARVLIAVDPAYKASFLRDVTIVARPTKPEPGERASFDAETILGHISQVHLAAATGPIDDRQMAIESILAANLHGNASVRIAVINGNDSPIPLQSVELQMRQRAICFDTTSGVSTYTLMYGDSKLPAPVYGYSRLFAPSPAPVQGNLGPEQRNPGFTPRADIRPFTERHPQLLWLGLFAALTALGGFALRGMRHQREGSHQ